MQEGLVPGDIRRGLTAGPRADGWLSDKSNPLSERITQRNGLHFMSILSEVVGHDNFQHISRIGTDKESASTERLFEHLPSNIQRQLSDLDAVDITYLLSKGAFWAPPESCWYGHRLYFLERLLTLRSKDLLRLFFYLVYPYIPVLNREEFLQSYYSSKHSILLLNSVLATTIPYTDLSVIQHAGFVDRESAQKWFYSNAVRLYDFGCETSQLHRLQSCLLLGTILLSFASEKDFRYWLQNAVRIASRMGLDRMYVLCICDGVI